MEPSRHSLSFGQETIPFTLAFDRRQRISITVHPDKRVQVVAPQGRSIDEIMTRVRRRAPWIVRQLDRFDRLHPLPTPRRYVGGETHLYLGRQYRLRFQTPEDNRECVKLQGRYLHVHTTERENPDRVKGLLDSWYRQHAHAVFSRRLEGCHTSVVGVLGIERPAFQLRKMPCRWGSCTKTGKVLLNPELVLAPLPCIDYVLTHELCHLKLLHHGPEFYRLLTRCMPDWERRKERLDSVGV
jgi:predicted metal-dependent hydrolase